MMFMVDKDYRLLERRLRCGFCKMALVVNAATVGITPQYDGERQNMTVMASEDRDQQHHAKDDDPGNGVWVRMLRVDDDHRHQHDGAAYDQQSKRRARRTPMAEYNCGSKRSPP